MGISAETEVTFAPIELDARVIIGKVSEGMTAYWAGSLRSGRNPSGGAMPTNSRGLPLGHGSGRISDNWTTTPPAGGENSAEAESSPYQDGRYFYAVRSISARVDIVSTEGEAGRELDELIDRAIPQDL